MAKRGGNEDTTELLSQIDRKLDQVLVLLSGSRLRRSSSRGSPTFEELLALPDHLRTTVMALNKVGKATCEKIARMTRKAGALESGYLNYLARIGIVRKERIGRKAYFYVPRKQGKR